MIFASKCRKNAQYVFSMLKVLTSILTVIWVLRIANVASVGPGTASSATKNTIECGVTGYAVIGGVRVTAPWTALVQVRSGSDRAGYKDTGSGVILSPATVLTTVDAFGPGAEDHLRHPFPPATWLRVGVGLEKSTNFKPDRFTQFLEPASVQLHRNLVVIHLKSNIKFSTRVRPICIEEAGPSEAAGAAAGPEDENLSPTLLTSFKPAASSGGVLVAKPLNGSWNPCNNNNEDNIFVGGALSVWKDRRWHLTGLVKESLCDRGNSHPFSTSDRFLSGFIEHIRREDLDWIHANIKQRRDSGASPDTANDIKSRPPLSAQKSNGTATGYGHPRPLPSAAPDRLKPTAKATVKATIATVAAVECGVAKLGKAYGTRIANGSRISAHSDWPWNAALFKRRRRNNNSGSTLSYICGATLISHDALLTAAHCVTDPSNGQPEPVNRYRAVLLPVSSEYGSNFGANSNTGTTRSPSVAMEITSIHVHEYYNAKTFEADIAVLKLKFDLGSGAGLPTHVSPVCVPKPGRESSQLERVQTKVGSVGTVLGFGDFQMSRVSPTLRITRLPIVGPRECREVSNLSPSTAQLCGGADGTAVCNGDSGGGLLFQEDEGTGRYSIQGIVSHGTGAQPGELPVCGTNATKYTIFTRVGAFKDWIETVLGS